MKHGVHGRARRALLARTGAALLPLAAAAPARSQAVQTVVAPRENVSIFSSGDDVADARGAYLWTSVLASGTRRRMLLRFDLAAIAPGSIVQQVSLELYQSRARAGHEVRVHRLLSSWTTGLADGGSQGEGAPATPGDVTWGFRNYPAAGQAGLRWQNPGADFDATPSAARFVSASSDWYRWQSNPAPATGLAPNPRLVADVQRWVDDPASNHGWILVGDEVNEQNAKRFESTRSGAAEVPVLRITHAPAPPVAAGTEGDVPLPAWAWGLLGASMAAAIARRRR